MPATASGGDLVALGKEQWTHYKSITTAISYSGKAVRSAVLNSITSPASLTPDELRQKVLDPQSSMADGFEKEYEKKKCRTNIKSCRSKRFTTLVAFLSTLEEDSSRQYFPSPSRRSSMQPKLKSKVHTADRDLGEVYSRHCRSIYPDVQSIVVREEIGDRERWSARFP